MRLLCGRDLAGLQAGLLDHVDVLPVRVGERLDVGTDLLGDVVGELRERLGLRLEVLVRGTGRRR